MYGFKTVAPQHFNGNAITCLVECRPRITIPLVDRFAALTARRNRTMTAKAIVAVLKFTGKPLPSRQTVYGGLVNIIFMPDVRQFVPHLPLITCVIGVSVKEST